MLVGTKSLPGVAGRPFKEVLIDPQITSAGSNLVRDFRQKIDKYKTIRGFVELIRRRYGVEKVQYAATTISFRGLELKQMQQAGNLACYA